MPIVAQFVATRVTSSPSTLITGSGILRGFYISTTVAATDGVLTFYDNTAASGTVLLVAYLKPQKSPHRLMFARDDAPRFATGLSVSYANIDILFWAIQLT